MQAYHESARAVIVHDKVVHADYLVAGHDDILDLPHELGVGCLTEQRRESIPCHTHAGKEDKQSNQHTCVAVDVDAEQIAHEHTQQNDGSRNGVGKAVGSRCKHGRGGNLLADGAVIKRHIDLDTDGYY